MKNLKKRLAYWLTVLVFSLVYYVIISVSLANEEKRECLEWQKQAREIKGFYLVPWQEKQCEHWGIKVDAPVIGKEREEEQEER